MKNVTIIRPTWMMHAIVAFVALAISVTSAQILSSTNIGGWHVSLSLPTNTYWSPGVIIANLTISNNVARGATYGLDWHLGDTVSPGCGNLFVIDRDSHYTHKFKYVSPRLSNGMEIPARGGTVDGQVSSEYLRTFDFNLSKYWAVTNPGNYQVYFTGAMPSLTEPGKTNVFQTAPLHFTILRKDEMRRPEQEN